MPDIYNQIMQGDYKLFMPNMENSCEIGPPLNVALKIDAAGPE
jgi:hypothetical protein